MICDSISARKTHAKIRTVLQSKGAFFWDYSGIGILGIDGIRVLLGAIPFSG